jgi:hypothetical protein
MGQMWCLTANMAENVIDYTVVSEHESGALVAKVCDLLKEGYEPLGGVQVVAPVLNGDEVAPLFAQAMIRKE